MERSILVMNSGYRKVIEEIVEQIEMDFTAEEMEKGESIGFTKLLEVIYRMCNEALLEEE